MSGVRVGGHDDDCSYIVGASVWPTKPDKPVIQDAEGDHSQGTQTKDTR